MTITTVPTPATTLRERMIEDMNLHRLCRTTQHGYLRDVTRFAIWLGRPPDTATEEDLRRYQIEQTEMGFGAPAMRDELLNETLFMSMGHAREMIAAWADDYNTSRPHSSLGYATPAAFAAELNKQWPASLRPAGSAAQAIAYHALMRNKDAEILIATG